MEAKHPGNNLSPPLGNEKLPAQTQISPDVLIKRAGGNILSPNTEASLQENALLLEKVQRCVLNACPLSQNLPKSVGP